MSPRTLAAHVLRALAIAQVRGRRLTLDDLVAKLKVRRADVRSVLGTLDQQGLLDVTVMRLTLQGFAIGTALRNVHLPPLRVAPAAQVKAA